MLRFSFEAISLCGLSFIKSFTILILSLTSFISAGVSKSSINVEEMPEDLESLDATTLISKFAELAKEAIPILKEEDLNLNDFRLAHLDLHMLGAALRRLGKEEPHNLLLAQSLVNEASKLAPGLTYQDLILTNPPEDLRRFLRGDPGQSERIFYEVHREIERRAGLVIKNMYDKDAPDFLRTNCKEMVTQLERFLTELPARDFAIMRPFYTNPKGISGPSAKFSAGIATLDSAIFANYEEACKKTRKKLEEADLFPNTNVKDDGFAGLQDIQSKLDSPIELPPLNSNIIYLYLDEFRTKHMRVVAKLLFGIGLDKPGMNDPIYMARREEIFKITQSYYKNVGGKIPKVEYTEEENSTWSYVLGKMQKKHVGKVCREYLKGKEALAILPDKIPQLQELDERMKDREGFRILPCEGWIDSRSFFKALARGEMYCTQYIRYFKEPKYTPEPDIIHEVLGHLPMMVFDSPFTSFTRLIGQAGALANEEELEQLEKLYWFTSEFGLIYQDGGPKVYGSSPCGSLGEIDNFLGEHVEKKPFNLKEVLETDFDIYGFQKKLFVVESFEQLYEDTKPYLMSIIAKS